MRRGALDGRRDAGSGLRSSLRSAMRVTEAGWGCVAFADGQLFLVESGEGSDVSSVRAAGSFFEEVLRARELVVVRGGLAASFRHTGLVAFAPGLLVGAQLGAGAVLVVADAEERTLVTSQVAALLDVVDAAREIVAAQRRAEMLSTQLFDASPDAMLVVSRDGRIMCANAGAESLLGYGMGELLERTIEDFVPPAARTDHARDRERYSAAPTPRQMGTRATMAARRRDGKEIPVDIMLGAFAVDEETHVLAVIRDMSAREEARASLRAKEEHLLRAGRLELLGQFAASVAHDFNNFLTVMRSCSELILSDSACTPEIRGEARDVHAAAEQGRLLTRQLLSFARRDAPLRRSISVSDVCVALAPMLRRLLGAQYELALRVEPELGVHAAEAHVEQIIMNLVVNARDAMPAGGVIELVARHLTSGPERSDVVPVTYVAIEVSDSGHGIAPDILGRIFEPLFTTKPADRGTGLGLAIVHRVATESGGHVRVETEVGRGTRFTVLIPSHVEAAAPPKRQTPSLPPRGTHILVVDDEPVNRRVLATILGRAGYEVRAAGSVEDALSMTRTALPDLVVTDVSMADGSGPELIAELRVSNPSLKALFVTGNPALCRDEAQRRGVADVLVVEKPFSVEGLTGQVAAALAVTLA
jgi:PAS domain S-box-containing protein